MGFDINQFRASFALTGEPASPSKYEFEIIGAPDYLDFKSYAHLKFRCESTDIPGRLLATTESKEYGPLRKIPYAGIYSDLTATFIVSDSMLEKNIFEDWHKKIVDNETDSDVEYYNNFIGSLRITQYNKTGAETLRIRIDEAYPVNVSAMPVSWTEQNAYHKLQVEFAIRYWRVEYVTQN